MEGEILRVTKRFSIEMGHALHNYDGLCKFVHGHSYKLYVTLRGMVKNETNHSKDGMVIDFSVLKKIVNEKIVDVYDHSLVVNENDPRQFATPEVNHRTILLPVQPTCENLLIHFKNIIKEHLPPHLSLVNVKLYETENSFAEWCIEDVIY